MNRKLLVGAVIVALAVVMTAGTLVASNMGFKLNYTLNQTAAGVSASGLNILALPDNRQTGLNTAKNLLDDIGLASVDNVQKFVKQTNLTLTYTGRIGAPATNNFALVAGEAVIVRMRTNSNYIVVGSDDPAVSYTLNATQGGVSASGLNLYAYNYHQTAATAKQLLDDIGLASVDNVQKFVKQTNLTLTYTGRIGAPATNNFALVPGEGYYVRMRTTTAYTPSHY